MQVVHATLHGQVYHRTVNIIKTLITGFYLDTPNGTSPTNL